MGARDASGQEIHKTPTRTAEMRVGELDHEAVRPGVRPALPHDQRGFVLAARVVLAHQDERRRGREIDVEKQVTQGAGA